jgi:hypothetical protein
MAEEPKDLYNRDNLRQSRLAIGDITELVKRLSEETDALNDTFSGGVIKNLKDSYKIYTDLLSTSGKFGSVESSIASTRTLINKITRVGNLLESDGLTIQQAVNKELSQELWTLKENLSKKREELKIAEERGKSGTKDVRIAKQYIDYYEKQIKLTRGNQKVLLAASKQFKDQEKSISSAIELLGDQYIAQNKLEKKANSLGSIYKALGKIPVANQFYDADAAMEALKTSLRAGKGSMKSLGISAKVFGKSIVAAMGPFAILAGAAKVFQMLVNHAFKMSEQITKLGKELNISITAASALRGYYADIEKSSTNTFQTTENFLKAQSELNEVNRTAFNYSLDLLKSQINLTKEVGLQADEASKLVELQVLNATTIEDIKGDVADSVLFARKRYGVELTGKKILQDVSKIQGVLSVLYENSPKQISRAVAQARALGLALEDTKTISMGLLNFEESIENVLTAQLFTNKQINLTAARTKAIMGDTAGATEELAKFVPTVKELSNMNPLAIEAMAKGLSMSADQMVEIAKDRELFNILGKDTLAQYKKQLQYLDDIGDAEGKRALLEAGRDRDAIAAVMEAQDLQTRTNQMIEKAMARLSDFIMGPAGTKLIRFMESFAERLGDVGFLPAIFNFGTSRVGLEDDIAEYEAKLASDTLGITERDTMTGDLERKKAELEDLNKKRNSQNQRELERAVNRREAGFRAAKEREQTLNTAKSRAEADNQKQPLYITMNVDGYLMGRTVTEAEPGQEITIKQ